VLVVIVGCDQVQLTVSAALEALNGRNAQQSKYTKRLWLWARYT
jgi:hypothetical protein